MTDREVSTMLSHSDKVQRTVDGRHDANDKEASTVNTGRASRADERFSFEYGRGRYRLSGSDAIKFHAAVGTMGMS